MKCHFEPRFWSLNLSKVSFLVLTLIFLPLFISSTTAQYDDYTQLDPTEFIGRNGEVDGDSQEYYDTVGNPGVTTDDNGVPLSGSDGAVPQQEQSTGDAQNAESSATSFVNPQDTLSYYPVLDDENSPVYDAPGNHNFEYGNVSGNPNLIQSGSHLSENGEEGFQVPEIPDFYLPFPAPVVHANEDFHHPLRNYHHNKLNFLEGLSILAYGAFGEFAKEVSVVVLIFLIFYVIFAFWFKDMGGLLLAPKKCDDWGWGHDIPEWEYHAEARFVPAVPADPYMQREFLDLFRALKRIKDKKKEDNSGSSSSEEDEMSMEMYSNELSYINEMCPHDAFFYGLAPHHILAYRALQAMFVAQPSPKEVLHLAKATLYSGKINPKVWYIGLLAASIERPDMTGYALAHPLDAMPDLFIAAHLITKDFEDKWRHDKERMIGTRARGNGSYFQDYSDYSPKSSSKKHKNKYNNYVGTNSTYKIRHQTKKKRITRELPVEDVMSVFNSTINFLGVPSLSKSKPSKSKASKTKASSMEKLKTHNSAEKSKHSYEKTKSKSSSSEKLKISSNTSAEKIKTSSIERTTSKPKSSSAEKSKVSSMEKTKIKGSSAEKLSINDNSTILHSRQGVAKPPIAVKNPVFPKSIVPDKHKGETEQDELNDDDGGKKKGDKKKGDKKKGKKKKGKKGKKGKKEKKECAVMDGSLGLDNGYENVLWYWREDMMLNQHHLYWHQLFPPNVTGKHPDRRSELFFYMHRSMLARYNAERLSNGLDRTYEQELKHGAIIAEGYNSHLADVNAGKYWTPRPPHTPLTDCIHEDDPDFARNIIIEEMLTILNRFDRGIHEGKLLAAKGGFVKIRDKKGFGIDPLGNTLEASELSINPLYYDAFGLHNLGHILIALSVDPEWHKKIPTGIMSEAAVSMRDPSFYTYHTIIDNLFERYKQTLPPYQILKGAYPLLWNGVEVVEAEILSQTGHDVNEIRTFYTQQRFELGPGVDGSIDKSGKTDICATHLDHEPFKFKIVIDRKPCAISKSNKATVRLIMAPRYDEHGERLPLVEQRRLFFPLDTFQVELKIGRNVITRRAEDSQLTVPWSKSLRQMEYGPDPTGAADYCGCGWPRHLYIPKGNHKGLAFDLFVMVTNFDDDFVPDDPRMLDIPETCNSPYIFCGRPRRRYPDSKPMGYPFDRPVYHVPVGHCPPGDVLCKWKFKSRPVATLEEYVEAVPNMASISFGIRHIDKLFHRKQKDHR